MSPRRPVADVQEQQFKSVARQRQDAETNWVTAYPLPSTPSRLAPSLSSQTTAAASRRARSPPCPTRRIPRACQRPSTPRPRCIRARTTLRIRDEEGRALTHRAAPPCRAGSADCGSPPPCERPSIAQALRASVVFASAQGCRKPAIADKPICYRAPSQSSRSALTRWPSCASRRRASANFC